jgi:hypothetical protein
MPDPLPKPPGRPPGEPIIIKRPPRPAEIPEIDGSLDEDDPEIKKLPEIVPEKPPPPAPWDRPDPGWQQKTFCSTSRCLMAELRRTPLH